MITFGVSRYWNLFQPDSNSWYVMYLTIKGTGLLLLSNSTSSRLLCFILLSAGLFYEQLSYLGWYVYLVSSAQLQKPTYRYLGGGKVSGWVVAG